MEELFGNLRSCKGGVTPTIGLLFVPEEKTFGIPKRLDIEKWFD